MSVILSFCLHPFPDPVLSSEPHGSIDTIYIRKGFKKRKQLKFYYLGRGVISYKGRLQKIKPVKLVTLSKRIGRGQDQITIFSPSKIVTFLTGGGSAAAMSLFLFLLVKAF